MRVVEIYDIIMIVVLLSAMIFGAVKGFAWQLASIASIVVSYIVAYRFREPFSESIQAEPPWNRFLAMLILYVGTSLVIWVAFRMIRGSIDRMKSKEFDRQIGAFFGLAKGALYCTLITLFAVTLSGDKTREKIVTSKSGRYIAQVLDQSESVIPADIHQVVGPFLEKFNDKLDQPGIANPTQNNVPWIAADPDNPSSFWDGNPGLGQPPSSLPGLSPGNVPGGAQPLPMQPNSQSIDPFQGQPAARPQSPTTSPWNGFGN